MNNKIKLRLSIIEAIKNPPKDMPDVEDLLAKTLREEINMELFGNKDGFIQVEYYENANKS